ncbi:hypothetical protein [Roseimaritima sediminicola]|uniref:hypothetical protein n=1 Tax=Roseimaritima sediminicola TaxID=2662066 RepID=UPI0012984B9A|nr:hypothetical protein [Roseimaritima sediminicola]
MAKFAMGFGVVLLTLSLSGCGSKPPVAEDAPQDSAAAPAASAQANAQSATEAPTAVVSEFLDRIRRGGAAQVEAVRLLTARAQAECQRTGLKMDSMGAPDARFEVTRSQPAPDAEDAALVHSVWTEPVADGTETTNEVVWLMKKEDAGWRISGLVLQVAEDVDPIAIDFEDGDQAAAVLGAAAPAAEATAAAPAATEQR